jgi:hypothetical protein
LAAFVVNAGLAVITGRLIGGASPAQVEPKFLAHGTGAGTTARTDTTLFTEASYTGYARVTGTSSQVTVSQTNDTYQVTGTIANNSGGSVTITNAGLLDASSSGNLFGKADFAGVPLSNGDSIAYTAKAQMS